MRNEQIEDLQIDFLLYKLMHCHISPSRFPLVSMIQSGEASDIICNRKVI